jgi:hypothetical protein
VLLKPALDLAAVGWCAVSVSVVLVVEKDTLGKYPRDNATSKPCERRRLRRTKKKIIIRKMHNNNNNNNKNKNNNNNNIYVRNNNNNNNAKKITAIYLTIRTSTTINKYIHKYKKINE